MKKPGATGKLYKLMFAMIVLIVVLLVFPYFVDPYIVSILYLLFIFIVLAQTFDIVGGYMGYVNLGHYMFFGIGAYTFSILIIGGTSIPLCFIAAIIASVAFAVLISYPIFRIRGDYFVVATLALVVLVEILAYNLDWLTRGSYGLSLPPGYHLFSCYYMALGLTLLVMITKYKVVNSKFGLGLISIREDEQVAEVFGVHTFKYKFLAFILSASFPGMAGALHAWYLSYIDPPTVFGLAVALTPIAMTLFGGMGTMFGPVVGVCILWIIEQAIWTQTEYLHFAMYGIILILVGIFMPGGVVKSKRVQALWEKVKGRFGRFAA